MKGQTPGIAGMFYLFLNQPIVPLRKSSPIFAPML